LYSRLEEVLGTADADYLMTHLPRDPNDQVATKADIGRLEDRFDRLENRVNDRFDRLEERLDRMQRFYVGTTVGSMTALTAIFSLVVAFFG
jgi:hypothetical protein